MTWVASGASGNKNLEDEKLKDLEQRHMNVHMGVSITYEDLCITY